MAALVTGSTGRGSLFECLFAGCENETVPRSLYCEEHRYPEPREDGICLHTFCHRGANAGSPWCFDHTRSHDESEELAVLRQTVRRAAFVAEHLMQMIDRETWRASGGDDGQGHYEGDYREEQTFEEIQRWKAAVAE